MTTEKSKEAVTVAILPPAQMLNRAELERVYDKTEDLLINNIPGGDDYYD